MINQPNLEILSINPSTVIKVRTLGLISKGKVATYRLGKVRIKPNIIQEEKQKLKLKQKIKI